MICCAASGFPSDLRTIREDLVERVEDLLEALEDVDALLERLELVLQRVSVTTSSRKCRKCQSIACRSRPLRPSDVGVPRWESGR